MDNWQFNFEEWSNGPSRRIREVVNNRPATMNAEILRDWNDIKRLAKNIEDNVDEIAKEEINCRRKKSQTEKHKKLIDTHYQMLENINQSIFLFKLINY